MVSNPEPSFSQNKAAASDCTALVRRCAEYLSVALMYSRFLSTSEHTLLLKLQQKTVPSMCKPGGGLVLVLKDLLYSSASTH